MWQPEGVNAGNIAAMAVDPHDLIRGQGTSGPGWKTGADAVDRLWQGKPRPLLGSTQPQSPNGEPPPAAGGH